MSCSGYLGTRFAATPDATVPCAWEGGVVPLPARIPARRREGRCGEAVGPGDCSPPARAGFAGAAQVALAGPARLLVRIVVPL